MASPRGPFYSELGQRLRDARRAAKLTQKQLADTVRISRVSVTNIELGQQPVDSELLVRLAEALTVSPVDLLPQPKAPVHTVHDALSGVDVAKREWVATVLTTGYSRTNGKPN